MPPGGETWTERRWAPAITSGVTPAVGATFAGFEIEALDNWTVCATAPDAGQPLAPGEAVVLFVERSC